MPIHLAAAGRGTAVIGPAAATPALTTPTYGRPAALAGPARAVATLGGPVTYRRRGGSCTPSACVFTVNVVAVHQQPVGTQD